MTEDPITRCSADLDSAEQLPADWLDTIRRAVDELGRRARMTTQGPWGHTGDQRGDEAYLAYHIAAAYLKEMHQ